MNKAVKNRVLPIRPFVSQKALFYFIGIVFVGLVLTENAVKADGVVSIENQPCSIASIQNKQKSYRKEKFYREETRRETKTVEKNAEIMALKKLDFELVKASRHDEKAYTQGLVYFKGYLYESIGGLGLSELRKLDVKTGEVLKSKKLPASYFGEGLAISNNHLIQLTLKKNTALVYDVENLEVINKFSFTGDGWGIVESAGDLLISDGSSSLQRMGVENYQLKQKVNVTVNGVELQGINEMENINGMIYANVWPTDCIAVIDSGKYNVVAWLDLSSLYPENKRLNESSVLNGIAYDAEHKQLIVTGKNWPTIYHLKLSEYPDGLKLVQ